MQKTEYRNSEVPDASSSKEKMYTPKGVPDEVDFSYRRGLMYNGLCG